MKHRYPLGTPRVPRASTYRLRVYLRGLGWAVALAAAAIGILSLVQAWYHPFDLVIEKADASLALVDRTLSKEAAAGVSIGALVLVGLVALLPLMDRGVRKRQYGVSFWRGLLSSAIFLATDKLYRYVQGLGLLYFSATLALFVVATIILVEIISRAGRLTDEADTRTELLASIVSGLVFGLLVQLGEYGLGLLGKLLAPA